MLPHRRIVGLKIDDGVEGSNWMMNNTTQRFERSDERTRVAAGTMGSDMVARSSRIDDVRLASRRRLCIGFSQFIRDDAIARP
jgi:hypothetical protein